MYWRLEEASTLVLWPSAGVIRSVDAGTAEARASEKKGSGLGLAIVKNLVNSLNGDVGVKNSPLLGSTFWFTLPVAK